MVEFSGLSSAVDWPCDIVSYEGSGTVVTAYFPLQLWVTTLIQHKDGVIIQHKHAVTLSLNAMWCHLSAHMSPLFIALKV